MKFRDTSDYNTYLISESYTQNSEKKVRVIGMCVVTAGSMKNVF